MYSIGYVFQSQSRIWNSIHQGIINSRVLQLRGSFFWNQRNSNLYENESLNFDRIVKKTPREAFLRLLRSFKAFFFFINTNKSSPESPRKQAETFSCWVHFGNAKYVIMPVILIAWMTFAWFEQETKSARLLYRCRIFCGNDFTRYSRSAKGNVITCVAYVKSGTVSRRSLRLIDILWLLNPPISRGMSR